MYSFRLSPNLQTSLIVSWEKLNKNYQYELVFSFIISVHCLNLHIYFFCREKMKVVWKFGLNQNRVHLTKNGQLAHKLKGVSACWGGGFHEGGGIGKEGGGESDLLFKNIMVTYSNEIQIKFSKFQEYMLPLLPWPIPPPTHSSHPQMYKCT